MEHVDLTKCELEVMQVLWAANEPIPSAEIKKRAEMFGKRSWKDSSIHIFLNSLLKKGVVKEAGFVSCGKTFGRLFDAAISCEEYFAELFTNSVPVDKAPDVFSGLLERMNLPETTLTDIEARVHALRVAKKEER